MKIRISNKEKLIYFLFSALIISFLVFYCLFVLFFENRMFGPITIVLVLAGLLFSFFWFLSAYHRSQTSRNFLLVLCSSIITIFLVESFMQYNDFTYYEDRHELTTLKKIQILNDYYNKNTDAHIRIPPDIKSEFAKKEGNVLFLSDITDEITILGEESDEMIVFRSDENGFRNLKGSYDSFEILLLGDSFTESSFVTEQDTIHSNLIRSGFATYNAGIGGTGLAHSLATFIEYGVLKKPKFTILNIIEGSSIHRMSTELSNEKFKRYYDSFESNNLLSKKDFQNKTLKKLINRQLLIFTLNLLQEDIGTKNINTKDRKSLLMQWIPQITHSLRLFKNIIMGGSLYKGDGVPRCSEMDDLKKHLQKILQFIHDKTKSFDGNFIITYFGADRYTARDWNDCEYNMLKELLVELDIPLIDMIEEFKSVKDPKIYFAKNYYRKDLKGHPNADGYRLVAEAISKKIRMMESLH